MDNLNKVNGDRLYQRIKELAKIGGKEINGINRFALTDLDRQAQLLVSKWMKDAGMEVRHDNFGNLIGRIEGKKPDLPSIMIGSHIDTVPNGGKFDGVIGVLGGIEVVQTLNEKGILHNFPIEVIAFCDEEGTRFSDGLFGSKGIIGLVTKDNLEVVDESGISRYNALKDFGFGINPNKIHQSVRKSNEIKCFLEMHIEQGPYLEENDFSVGIVEGIAGPAWLRIIVNGMAGHAGTVPMDYRRDPMVGASEIIKEIELICKDDTTNSLVGTVGKINAYPGGRNVIPSSIEFTLDIRDIDIKRRSEAIRKIEEQLQHICEDRNLSATIEVLQEIDPVRCSDNIINAFKKSSESLNLDAPVMLSGAGHDAMYMSRITDMGMIFVRSKNGISHNPAEWSSKEDIEQGTLLLLKTVVELMEK